MKDSLIPIFILIALALCCCAIVALGTILFGLYELDQNIPSFPSTDFLEETPTLFDFTRIPVLPDNTLTLQELEKTIIPQRDLGELACRFRLVCDAPLTLFHPDAPYSIGDQRLFWISNSDTGEYSQITATLEYLTPHAYFWVENGVPFRTYEAERLIDTFEEQIYPTNRSFFGSEWSPGVDNDPHIYIIYARDLGATVAGYFISLDEYNPLVVERSNAIEAFYIDSSQDLGSDYTYGTLAHEFQHMIHWYQDANESSFLDEGFSQLATFLNHYDTGGFDWYYIRNPDIPLTDWQESGENYAHYGANFLFVTYFLDRFGEETTKALIHDQQNELESVDNVFKLLSIRDPITDQIITADNFFLDWVIANYLHDPTKLDGRYFYSIYPDSPKASYTEQITSCPSEEITRTVNQYGVDYIRIMCLGDHTIFFSGATLIPLLPVNPHSGDYAIWSNKANESNTSMSREFDFTSLSGPITMEYWTWYEIEENYDYVYLEASTDSRIWEILETSSGTLDNPTGASYGWGYTGQTDGWIKETVDLTRFAGQKVILRFDYITDAAVVEKGFLIDDISIAEIGYFEDFETDEGEWERKGFVRIQNSLPQTYQLAMIVQTAGETRVEMIDLADDQTAEIPFTLERGEDVVLVVTATTRFTIELAPYRLEIR